MRNSIRSWYREMALKYHPDRTLDSGAAMSAINHGYERLKELLGIAGWRIHDRRRPMRPKKQRRKR
jgi:hypothetical protein